MFKIRRVYVIRYEALGVQYMTDLYLMILIKYIGQLGSRVENYLNKRKISLGLQLSCIIAHAMANKWIRISAIGTTVIQVKDSFEPLAILSLRKNLTGMKLLNLMESYKSRKTKTRVDQVYMTWESWTRRKELSAFEINVLWIIFYGGLEEGCASDIFCW